MSRKNQPKFVEIIEQTKEVEQQKETKGDNEFMPIEKPDKIVFTLVAKGKKNKEIDSITQKSMESARIQSEYEESIGLYDAWKKPKENRFNSHSTSSDDSSESKEQGEIGRK